MTLTFDPITPSPFNITSVDAKNKRAVIENTTYRVIIERRHSEKRNITYDDITIVNKTDNVLTIKHSYKENEFSIIVPTYCISNQKSMKNLMAWIQYSMDCISLISIKLEEVIDKF